MKFHINFTKIFFDALKILIKIFWKFAIPIIIVICILILLLIYWFFYFRVIEKIKPKPSYTNNIKKDGFFKKIFYKLPKQLAYDLVTQDPNSFNEFGIHMFCGSQGSGKTITAIYFLREWQRKYPRLQVYTNIFYKYSDGKIDSWKDLIVHENGIYGVVNFYDEVHTAFSSKRTGSNIPPQLLSEVSYQRKQKKALVMTAQVFGRVDKALREQVDFLYLPKTYFNVLTIVRKVDPLSYDTSTNRFRTKKGMFFFVHDRELREMYDTYEKVKTFVENDEVFEPSIYAGTLSATQTESS